MGRSLGPDSYFSRAFTGKIRNIPVGNLDKFELGDDPVRQINSVLQGSSIS